MIFGGFAQGCFPALSARKQLWPRHLVRPILDNLKAGNFYSSEGPKLDMYLSGDSLVVKSDEKATVSFLGRYGIPYVKSIMTPGEKEWASYRLQGDEGYVRVEVQRHSDGKQAWSQPIFVETN